MKRWFIYALTDPRNENIRYVGWTVNPTQRLRDHCKPSRLARFHTHCDRWIRQVIDAGSRPVLTILECGITDRWAEAESEWIIRIRSSGADLTNITTGGQGNPGWKPSSELRAQWSRVRKGRKPHPNAIARTIELWKGKKRPEIGKAVSEGIRRSGYIKTEAHCRAISEGKKGKSPNFSDAHRQGLRERLTCLIKKSRDNRQKREIANRQKTELNRRAATTPARSHGLST